MQTSVLLRPREPFSFTRTLRFILSPPALLNGRQFAPLLDYFEDGEYRRVADIEGQPVLYGVSERQPPPATLRVRILAGPAGPQTRRAVRPLAERQFPTPPDLGSRAPPPASRRP